MTLSINQKPRLRVRSSDNCTTFENPKDTFGFHVFHNNEIKKSAGFLQMIEAKRTQWARSGLPILTSNVDKFYGLIQLS